MTVGAGGATGRDARGDQTRGRFDTFHQQASKRASVIISYFSHLRRMRSRWAPACARSSLEVNDLHHARRRPGRWPANFEVRVQARRRENEATRNAAPLLTAGGRVLLAAAYRLIFEARRDTKTLKTGNERADERRKKALVCFGPFFARRLATDRRARAAAAGF